MRGDISKALIVDNNHLRGQSIQDRLAAQDVVADHLLELAVHDVARGRIAGNFNMDVHLDGVALLFIHLGYPDAVPPEHRSGNHGAMECLLDYKEALQETCVIAYSGGPRPPPDAFARFRRDAWHGHFERVLRGTAFNIAALVTAWRRHPDLPPPLALLTKKRRAANFSSYLAAYQKDNPPTVALWRNVLIGDGQYGQLLDELADASSAPLRGIACGIHDFLSSTQAAPETKATFPSELHDAIMRCNPWPQGKA
jgi:hypothetical protein